MADEQSYDLYRSLALATWSTFIHGCRAENIQTTYTENRKTKIKKNHKYVFQL